MYANTLLLGLPFFLSGNLSAVGRNSVVVDAHWRGACGPSVVCCGVPHLDQGLADSTRNTPWLLRSIVRSVVGKEVIARRKQRQAGSVWSDRFLKQRYERRNSDET